MSDDDVDDVVAEVVDDVADEVVGLDCDLDDTIRSTIVCIRLSRVRVGEGEREYPIWEFDLNPFVARLGRGVDWCVLLWDLVGGVWSSCDERRSTLGRWF